MAEMTITELEEQIVELEEQKSIEEHWSTVAEQSAFPKAIQFTQKDLNLKCGFETYLIKTSPHGKQTLEELEKKIVEIGKRMDADRLNEIQAEKDKRSGQKSRQGSLKGNKPKKLASIQDKALALKEGRKLKYKHPDWTKSRIAKKVFDDNEFNNVNDAKTLQNYYTEL
jgi:hypothetical protein